MGEAEPLGLSAILDMVDAGDESLLAEDERALLPAKLPRRTDFGANLAETLSEADIAKLAQDAHDGYTSDDASRADWRRREKLGLRLLGVSENDPFEPPFEGASSAVHPGLMEAIIQFQARAIAELWPPEGPAKVVAEGEGVNPMLEQQAGRVAKYLNWAYTQRMPGGYRHHDRMLFRLPLSGSAFKKVYYCPLAQAVVSAYVPAEDLIVPYGADDLETAPRVTHLLRYAGSDVMRLIESGAYRDVPLAGLSDGADKTDLQSELDAVAGSRLDTATIDEHERYVFLEQSIRTSLPGDPPNSPYLVTLERDSQTVFAVYRDWREGDPQRKRRERFAHYYFFPGLDGFYGLGFLHVLGRLAESLSGNLRSLLDAGTLANLRGGFRSADVRLPRGNREDGIGVKPGEWIPVEATTEELQKLFVQIPYGEPSQTLFNLLQYLDELIRRVAGTTSELLGESTKNVPVGTTLARIEQGLKVQTAIQIRCHQAQAKELALVCQAVADNLPDEAYCRDVLGMAPEQFAAEFDGRVDVRPVSDPNSVTATQRMVIAQALVERAAQAPDLYDRVAVERKLLETMRVQDIDALLPDRSQQTPRMGPVEESMSLAMMKPVKAYPDQDHAAHIVVHRQWLDTLTDHEMRQRVEPAAIAHMAEHVAWDYFVRMQQAMGVQLPAAPMGMGQPMDPQTENALALMAANAVQLMGQTQAQQQQPAIDPAVIESAGKAQAEEAKAAAEIRRKDAIANAQIERDDLQAIARMQRDVAQQEARLAAQFVSDQSRDALGQIPQ